MKILFYLFLIIYSPLMLASNYNISNKFIDFRNARILTSNLNEEFPQEYSSNLNYRVSGKITDIHNVGLSGIKVELKQNGQLIKETNTGINGEYEFTELVPGLKYLILPVSNQVSNVLTGVTAGDILHIIKHILGIEQFSNPYLVVAADVNNSHSVTAADIVEIRKLILGLNSSFKRSTWSFLRPINISQNPWVISEYRLNQEVDEADLGTSIDFIGVKTADINY
ncbi:MAG: SdrD B-like domain-containing protein [Saprospiraceae bacterium]